MWKRRPRSVVLLATSFEGMYTSGAASTDPLAALSRSAIGACMAETPHQLYACAPGPWSCGDTPVAEASEHVLANMSHQRTDIATNPRIHRVQTPESAEMRGQRDRPLLCPTQQSGI